MLGNDADQISDGDNRLQGRRLADGGDVDHPTALLRLGWGLRKRHAQQDAKTCSEHTLTGWRGDPRIIPSLRGNERLLR
jgi:hypothetical protein